MTDTTTTQISTPVEVDVARAELASLVECPKRPSAANLSMIKNDTNLTESDMIPPYLSIFHHH